LQFAFSEVKNSIGASNYENQFEQDTLNQFDTEISVGVERRFFFPKHYFVLQTGVLASFVDMPTDSGNPGPSGNDLFQYSDLGYFGLYGAVGVRRLFGESFDCLVLLGTSYQNSGDSYRATQYARIEARRQLTDFIHVGIKLDEFLAAYRFNENSNVLIGQGHSLTWRPALFVDWSF
jgi:hypothetical protein